MAKQILLPQRTTNPLYRAKNYVNVAAGMPDPERAKRMERLKQLSARQPVARGEKTKAAQGAGIGLGSLGLADPNADRIPFWDDGAGALAWLTLGSQSGVAISGTDIVRDELFIAQTADYTGSNVNTAQKVFNASTNGAANVAASTAYIMEGVYHIHTTGTTSRIFYVLFGGTATLTSIGYNVMWTQPATEVGGSVLSYYHNAATEISLTGAIATATHHDVVIRGIVRVNGAGTFIPQFRFSAAPGVAPVILRNSYFRLIPMGSDSVATLGSWS